MFVGSKGPGGMANNFVLRFMGLRFRHAMWNLLPFLLPLTHMHFFSLCRKWLRACVQPAPSSISPSVQPLCPLCAFDNQQVLWSDVTCCLLWCYAWFCSNHGGACGQCGCVDFCAACPLNQCMFLDSRAKMQELWLARRSSHETGEASLRDWLRLVCKAIQAVFCEQDWEHALQPKGSTMFALPCFEDVVHNLGMSFLLTYFGLFGMAILKPTRLLTNLTKLLPC